MDVVVPYKESGYDELRYALRSLEMYFNDVGNVFIVGDLPAWVNPRQVIHVKLGDEPGIHNKERNIMRKVLHVCSNPTLSEEFLFMNDDHFLLQPLDYPPYYYESNLKYKLDTRASHDHYYHSLLSTFTALKRNRKPTRYFDIHTPIVYNKYDFIDVMTFYNWDIAYGYVIKSLYCNTLKIPGEYMKDLKINSRLKCPDLEAMVKGRQFFSVGEQAVNVDMGIFLQYLYRTKSKYEL